MKKLTDNASVLNYYLENGRCMLIHDRNSFFLQHLLEPASSCQAGQECVSMRSEMRRGLCCFNFPQYGACLQTIVAEEVPSNGSSCQASWACIGMGQRTLRGRGRRLFWVVSILRFAENCCWKSSYCALVAAFKLAAACQIGARRIHFVDKSKLDWNRLGSWNWF